MLKRNKHAEIAPGRIDASDEGYQQNRRDALRRREYEAGENDQSGAGEKKIPQLKPRCDEARDQGQRRRSKQRGAGDYPDLLRRKADGREIDRKNDDRKAIAKS